MAKYHINPQGNAARCSAREGQCPFGNNEQHYSTPGEARASYELSRESSFGPKPIIQDNIRSLDIEQSLPELGPDLSYQAGHSPLRDGVQGYMLDNAFPGIYDNSRPYALMSRDEYGQAERESLAAIHAMRDNPQVEMSIYRALPSHVPQVFNEGDWVTLSPTYAKIHALQEDGSSWSVIETRVKASEIRCDGDSVNEFGYFPSLSHDRTNFIQTG